MKFFLALVVLSFAEVVLFQTIFNPGFIAPDVVLLALLARAFLRGRDTILWAFVGGLMIDILTDSLGLNIALYSLSVYLFLPLAEKFIFRSFLTFLVPASIVLLLKKVGTFLLVGFKFSFEVDLPTFLISWILEILLGLSLYFVLLKGKGP